MQSYNRVTIRGRRRGLVAAVNVCREREKMAGKRIVVVGGGFGGVAAARTARALLDRDHEVTLVDRMKRTYLCGSFPLLIVGEREVTKVSRSLGLLANRGIRFVQGEVEGIDVSKKTVVTSTGRLGYDYLVLAPGAEYDWGAVPGASRAYSFYDLQSARRLRRKLSSFRKGRIVIAVSSLPYKCPPAPYEAALLLDWALTRRGVRKQVDLHVYTPEPVPIPVAGPKAANRLMKDMGRRGVQVHTGVTITEVASSGREAVFSDGTVMDAQLVITVPTHRLPPIIATSGLADGSGWVEVSPNTLQTRHPDVYAVGDVTTVPMANGRPLPKAGVFASAEGETVGRNIAAAINGYEPTTFNGKGHCFIAYSDTRAGMVRGEFLAEGKPNVRFQPPSARGNRAKERFEGDWRRFRI